MDIRDSVIEDALFDPFEDEDEQDQEELAEGEEPETPLIGQAMEERPEPEEDTRPPRQRIYELLGQMPGQKRVLLAVIDFCREEKTGEEMDAFTEKLQENAYSVYTPVILRELLEKAGAIRYEVDERPDEQEQAREGDGDPTQGLETSSGAEDAALLQCGGFAVEGSARGEAASADDALSAEDLERAAARASLERASGAADPAQVAGLAFAASAAGFDESEVLHEHFASGEDDIDIEYLEIGEAASGVWVATPEGIEIVDEQDDYGQIKRLLGQEPKYQDIYQRILDFCKEEGRSAKELDNLVNDDPLLEEPRRYSGYFVGRLEREGAIQWSGGWVLTKDGARMLQTLLEEAAARV